MGNGEVPPQPFPFAPLPIRVRSKMSLTGEYSRCGCTVRYSLVFPVINAVSVLWEPSFTSSFKCKCCIGKKFPSMQWVQQHFQLLPLPGCSLGQLQYYGTDEAAEIKPGHSHKSRMFPGTELRVFVNDINSPNSTASLVQDKCVPEKSCFFWRFFTITPLNDLNYCLS